MLSSKIIIPPPSLDGDEPAVDELVLLSESKIIFKTPVPPVCLISSLILIKFAALKVKVTSLAPELLFISELTVRSPNSLAPELKVVTVTFVPLFNRELIELAAKFEPSSVPSAELPADPIVMFDGSNNQSHAAPKLEEADPETSSVISL